MAKVDFLCRDVNSFGEDAVRFYAYLKYVLLYTFYWMKRRYKGFLNKKSGI